MGGWPHLDDGDDEAAVDDELRERRRAQIAVAAVPQHEAAQVRELRHREVGGERSVLPLLALDADADVRRLCASADDITSWARAHVWASRVPPAGCSGRQGRWGIITWIMATSLPPSPMAAVMHCVCCLISPTTSAFCVGVQRQQMTVGAAHATSMKRSLWYCTHVCIDAPSRTAVTGTARRARERVRVSSGALGVFCCARVETQIRCRCGRRVEGRRCGALRHGALIEPCGYPLSC